jgi:redox-sensing transcriptional repressor
LVWRWKNKIKEEAEPLEEQSVLTKEVGLKQVRLTSEIPTAVLKRLPIYYRFLNNLAAKGVIRVSSIELASKMGVTASQLRRDLSWFGSFGRLGYGYRVTTLLGEIRRILGLNQPHCMVLTGVGCLGRAIVNYGNFQQRGFSMAGLFDRDQQVIGETINGLIVRDVAELPEFLAEYSIDIGIITAPAASAREIAVILAAGGIKGIWSFAPFTLKVPADVMVEHVHLDESLLVLSLRMQQNQNNSEEVVRKADADGGKQYCGAGG